MLRTTKYLVSLISIFMFCFFGFFACNSFNSNTINFAHLSFDDVELSMQNLANNNYENLFEEPFFNYLNSLHDKYDIKISLYTYNDSLNPVSNKYRNEFFNAKDWLKFGLHSTNSQTTLNNLNYAEAKNLWERFVENVYRITGTYESVDRLPRLHSYKANNETIQGFIDAEKYGALGLLCSDDSRISYNLTNEESQTLYENDFIITNQKFIMLRTDMRFDWFKYKFTSEYNYIKPIYNSAYQELEYRYKNSKLSNQMYVFVVFGHEWDIYDGNQLNIYDKRVEDFCKFCCDYNILLDFPQNQLNTFIKL